MTTQTPPGAAPVRGEQWTVTQCCAHWLKEDGRPLGRTTWFDYVRKGYAPEPLPWATPSGARVWDSAAVVEAYDARVGSGGRRDPAGWVAVRELDGAREYWRGPDEPTTPTLAEATTWQTQALTEKALTAAFGPGGRWKQPKWDGFVPMRRAGAALLDTAAVLPERAQHVLRRRAQGATLRIIGDELGLTRERIRQIEAEAVTQLSDCATPTANR